MSRHTSTDEIAISVRGLSKSYTLSHDDPKHSTTAEALLHTLKSFRKPVPKETFWALDDVSFDILRGDVVGIIGRNGAGKSTLLKIVSRITEPTRGRIDLYGRVGSLLEVGTGFHADLTGRENVYLNGAILGMSRREVARQFDAIVDFADVDRFLDTPVKRYSSGMHVRLAFAVAAHLNAEILVIDEVLAVGDAEFQKKCLGKMQDVASSGRTVLFVSHHLASVSNLCNKSLVLQRGGLQFCGPTQEAIDLYVSANTESGAGRQKDLPAFRPSWGQPFITSARVLDADGRERTHFPLGSDVTFELTFGECEGRPIRSPVMGVVVNHATFGTTAGVNMRMTNFQAESGPYSSATLRCRIDRFPFLQGSYTIDLYLGDGPTDVDALLGYLSFQVEDTDVYGSGRPPFAHMGVVFMEPTWQVVSDRSKLPVGAGA